MWGISTGGGNHEEIHYEDGYREKITQNPKPQYVHPNITLIQNPNMYTQISLSYKGK
jgi:hypothetical protein